MTNPVCDEIRSRVSDIESALSDLVGERDTATARASSLSDELAAVRGDLDRVTSERDQLRQLLAQQQIPPTRRPMRVGATVDPRAGLKPAQAVAVFEASIGAQIGVRRSFNSSAPSTWSACSAAIDTGRARIVSFTSGTRAQWAGFLRTVPRDGIPTIVVHRHEPDKGLRVTGPAFVAMQAELLAAVDEVKHPDVQPAIVLTSWLERDPTGTVKSTAYFPPNPARWLLLVDPYDIAGKLTLRDLYSPTLSQWRKAGGQRWGIAEVGTHLTGQAGVLWLERGITEARADGAEFFCWFHSGVGDQAGTQGWWLDDIAMRRTFGAHCPQVD